MYMLQNKKQERCEESRRHILYNVHFILLIQFDHTPLSPHFKIEVNVVSDHYHGKIFPNQDSTKYI